MHSVAAKRSPTDTSKSAGQTEQDGEVGESKQSGEKARSVLEVGGGGTQMLFLQSELTHPFV